MENKTPSEMMKEVEFLRKRVAELEQLESWQKKIKQVLQDSETKYKTLYDSSADAVMIATPDRGFLSGNKTAIKMFRCKDEKEFISLTPADLSPEYQPDGTLSSIKAQKMMKTAIENGSHFFEWVHKRKDGDEFPATVLLSRMQLEEKTVLQATVRDITDSKKAEEKLKQISLEWDRTFNAISDAIFIQDKDHNVVRVNKAFADMMHSKPEDLIGRKCYELVHGLNKPWPNCPAEKTKIDKTPHTEEVEDPNIGIPLLVSTSPIIADNGEIVGVVHVSKDISIYKKAQQEMAQLAAIVVSSEDAIIGKAIDGIIFSWNRAAEKMYGYSLEEIKGRSISVIIPPENISELDMIRGEVGSGRHIEHFETIRVKKDGTRINVSLTFSPIKDDMGRIIGVSTIARDITERKIMETEFKKKMEMLERFQKITVDRELKMKELKAEIGHLKGEQTEEGSGE